MTLKGTQMRGKEGYERKMLLKFGRDIRVGYLHLCAKFHVSRTNSFLEGVEDLWRVDFFEISKVFYIFFSTIMIELVFLFIQWFSSNTDGLVFLSKNAFVEEKCTFCHESLLTATFCHSQIELCNRFPLALSLPSPSFSWTWIFKFHLVQIISKQASNTRNIRL